MGATLWFALAPVLQAWNVGLGPVSGQKKGPRRARVDPKGIGPTCKSRYVVELIVIRTTRTTRKRAIAVPVRRQTPIRAQKIPHDAKSGAMLARQRRHYVPRVWPLARKVSGHLPQSSFDRIRRSGAVNFQLFDPRIVSSSATSSWTSIRDASRSRSRASILCDCCLRCSL